MATARAVLVTGLSGLIGQALLRHAGGRFDLRALNRRPVAGVPCHRADIADLGAIEGAFAGVDTVVHLAALASMSAPFEDILRANVVGTYNVFEAARRAGVRRVVFASSGAVVSGYEREMPYRALVTGRYDEVGATWRKLTHEDAVRPAGLYGASKVWGEALARQYADAHGLSTIALRIGHVTRDDRAATARDLSVWCSQRDIARMIEACVEAPPAVGCEIFFVVGRNRWSYRDMEHPRRVLGYEPLDAADDHR